VAQLGPDGLRAAGYSQSKTRALLALAAEVDRGALPLEDWVQASDAGAMRAADVDAAMQQLLAVPGVGPRTVHYTLLRGLGWPDGSLHGDVAVRKALARLQGVERVTEAQARDWLAVCPLARAGGCAPVGFSVVPGVLGQTDSPGRLQAGQLRLRLCLRQPLQQQCQVFLLADLQLLQQGVVRIGDVPALLQIGLHAQQQVGGHLGIGQRAVGLVGRRQLQVAHDAAQRMAGASG
jgi:hypothetical protein